MAAAAGRSLPNPAAPPLVGREGEQAQLRAALAAALAGRGALVLIGGEAGIGKTALAEATLAEATARGALALVGRCYDLGETPPYGPWAEALERAPRGDGLPALPTAVLPPERGGEALASQEAILRRVRDYLAALAAARPLVLLLEDLHWADPTSFDLLRVLARQLGDRSLLLLATYRAEEVAGDQPLAALLPPLVREARAARLDLGPLDTPAIGDLVAARYALGGTDRDRLVRYLAARTEGNALFLGELLRTLEQAGILRREDEGWALGDPAAVPVPALLRQVIGGRAARLGEEVQRLLAIAAVIGQEVPLDVWAAVAGTDEDGLLDAIERATAARLLAALPAGDAVRFPHALIREALYEGTLPPRRRAWHRRIGELLAARAGADAAAVAHHLRQAGDARAAAWLIAAGERAQDAYAWLIAAERFEMALVELGRHGGDAADRAWLLTRLAMLRRITRLPEALERLQAARRLAAEVGDRALLAYLAHATGYLRCFAGDFRQGLPAQEAGLAALAALPMAERARLGAISDALGDPCDARYGQGTLVVCVTLVGRFAEACALGERLLAQAPDATGEAGARGLPYADACYALVTAYAALGLPDRARQAAARARDLFRAAGHFAMVASAAEQELSRVALIYQPDHLAGRERLAAEAERAYVRASGVLTDSNRMTPRSLRLALLLLEGQWDEVRQLVRALLAETGATWQHLFALSLLGRVAYWRGESARAWALVREGMPAGPATAPGDTIFLDTLDLQRLAAALALEAGDLPVAHAWLVAHDRWLAWAGATLGRAEGALTWAAYHRAAGDHALAREAAQAALAHAAAPRQPLALLAAHRALGELDTTAGRHADAAAHLETALALTEACAAPHEWALTLLALAGLREATGDAGAARSLLDSVRATCVPLGAARALAAADALAARLPALPGTPDPDPIAPARLTPRERAILRLIAAGETNRAITAALGVSGRTVDRHITNLYRKIGARGKADATAYAYRHGLLAPESPQDR